MGRGIDIVLKSVRCYIAVSNEGRNWYREKGNLGSIKESDMAPVKSSLGKSLRIQKHQEMREASKLKKHYVVGSGKPLDQGWLSGQHDAYSSATPNVTKILRFVNCQKEQVPPAASSLKNINNRLINIRRHSSRCDNYHNIYFFRCYHHYPYRLEKTVEPEVVARTVQTPTKRQHQRQQSDIHRPFSAFL